MIDMNMKSEFINMNDVTVTFRGGHTAVDHASLVIPHGIYGLLGENGAGKTTLMRVLATLIRPASGTVSMGGLAYDESNYQKIRQKIGYLPQELNLYPNLTLRESLFYMGRLSGLSKQECAKRLDFYLEKTSLTPHQKKKNRQLSGGMKRRAGLVQAMLSEPDFLIVDEPTTGLDPEERVRIRNLIVDFSKERTVLFSTHVVEDLEAVCSQLSVMKKGSFLYSGSVRELLSMAEGHVWVCHVKDEAQERSLGRRYRILARQYVGDGMQVKLLSDRKPELECHAPDVTLEDAYMVVSGGAHSLA